MSDLSPFTARINSSAAQKGFELLHARAWALGLLLYGLSIIGSIVLIDRPLARFAARFHLYEGVLASTPVTAPVLLGVAIVAVLVGAMLFSSRIVLPTWARSAAVVAILASLAMSWGECLTDSLLQPLFARHEPFDYLFRGQYGWFAHAGNLASFPSGHAVQIASVASVLWAYYPKGRFVYLAAVVVVAIAMILAERHFLSDILAGALIGAGAGFMITRIWRTRLDELR